MRTGLLRNQPLRAMGNSPSLLSQQPVNVRANLFFQKLKQILGLAQSGISADELESIIWQAQQDHGFAIEQGSITNFEQAVLQLQGQTVNTAWFGRDAASERIIFLPGGSDVTDIVPQWLKNNLYTAAHASAPLVNPAETGTQPGFEIGDGAGTQNENEGEGENENEEEINLGSSLTDPDSGEETPDDVDGLDNAALTRSAGMGFFGLLAAGALAWFALKGKGKGKGRARR